MAFLIQLPFKFWYPEQHTGHLIVVPKCKNRSAHTIPYPLTYWLCMIIFPLYVTLYNIISWRSIVK